MFEIRHYLTVSGRDPFEAWLDSLSNVQTEARIAARVARLAVGNFGDCKPLRDGVWELRIHWGPGYRVYYAMAGQTVVLLLYGGDKRRQSADISRAVEYWNDYQQGTAKS
jgi:putative addiction module killer protein